MSEIVSTAEEDLAALGIIATYVWKPNRLKVKNPNPSFGGSYIPIDIISDGTAQEISALVSEEGQKQISDIDDLADIQKATISSYERDYTTVRANLVVTYQRMYNYFVGQGLIALATIMATAIVNLSLM